MSLINPVNLDCKLPEFTIKYRLNIEVERISITSSKNAESCLRKLFDPDTICYSESFVVLFLNKANQTIGWHRVSIGGISGTVADPKVILGLALLSGASAIILSHNHPSGNLRPSEADRQVTKKIQEGAKFLDLAVLDHLILSEDGYYSMADECDL